MGSHQSQGLLVRKNPRRGGTTSHVRMGVVSLHHHPDDLGLTSSGGETMRRNFTLPELEDKLDELKSKARSDQPSGL